MSQHPKRCSSVPAPMIGVYYERQPSSGKPHHSVPLAEAREMKANGDAGFINHGQAVRVYGPTPEDADKKSTGRADSLMIDEPVMNRYVMGDRYAKAAVNAWRPRFNTARQCDRNAVSAASH